MSNPAFTQVSQQNRELVDPYAVLQRRRNVRAAQGALRWLFLSHDQRAPAIPVEEQAVNVPSYVQGRTKRDSRPSSQALAADIVADFARVLREFADEQLIDTAWKREGGNLVDELYHHHRGLENVFASNRPYAVLLKANITRIAALLHLDVNSAMEETALGLTQIIYPRLNNGKELQGPRRQYAPRAPLAGLRHTGKGSGSAPKRTYGSGDEESDEAEGRAKRVHTERQATVEHAFARQDYSGARGHLALGRAEAFGASVYFPMARA